MTQLSVMSDYGSRHSRKCIRLRNKYRFFTSKFILKADIIVKAVMISLILCSVYSWAVIIEKYDFLKK